MKKTVKNQVEDFLGNPSVCSETEERNSPPENKPVFPGKKKQTVRTEKESFISRAVPVLIVFALFAAILFAGISDTVRQNKAVAHYAIGEQTPTGNRGNIFIDGTPGEEYIAGKTFYATASGKKYHENKDCRYIKGRKIREIDHREILSGTLKPCSSCVGKGNK